MPTWSHGLPAVHALHIASPFRDAAGPSSSGVRAEGKRLVAVPQGAPPPLEGCRQFPERRMETVGETEESLTGLFSNSDSLLCPAFRKWILGALSPCTISVYLGDALSNQYRMLNT